MLSINDLIYFFFEEERCCIKISLESWQFTCICPVLFVIHCICISYEEIFLTDYMALYNWLFGNMIYMYMYIKLYKRHNYPMKSDFKNVQYYKGPYNLSRIFRINITFKRKKIKLLIIKLIIIFKHEHIFRIPNYNAILWSKDLWMVTLTIYEKFCKPPWKKQTKYINNLREYIKILMSE
jgi:hypothetical protein